MQPEEVNKIYVLQCGGENRFLGFSVKATYVGLKSFSLVKISLNTAQRFLTTLKRVVKKAPSNLQRGFLLFCGEVLLLQFKETAQFLYMNYRESMNL